MTHHHHEDAPLGHHLGSLAVLGAVLLLPPELLMRALKRLAILAGVFAVLVVGAVTAANVSKPLCYLGPYINSPPSNDPQLCKEAANAAAKRAAEGQAAMADLERLLERDRPR